MSTIVPLRKELILDLTKEGWKDLLYIVELGKCLGPYMCDKSPDGYRKRQRASRQIAQALALVNRVGQRVHEMCVTWANQPEVWPKDVFYVIEKSGSLCCRAIFKFDGIVLYMAGIEFLKHPSASAGYQLYHALADIKSVMDCPYRPQSMVA